jgi:hypothetical protein
MLIYNVIDFLPKSTHNESPSNYSIIDVIKWLKITHQDLCPSALTYYLEK